MLHPYTRILLLLMLAVLVQFLPFVALLLAGVLLSAVAFVRYPEHLHKMLRRTRWLLLTLLLVFAFTTPGEYLKNWPLAIAPTYEGIFAGVLQAGRLVIILAGLALLMGTTSRESLMSGIHILLWPMRLIGISTERFTARLWLTLHYFELAPVKAAGEVWTALDQVESADGGVSPEYLRIETTAFMWRDVLVLCICCAGLWWWLL